MEVIIMNTKKLKSIFTFALLFYSAEVCSQNDSVITYYPYNITIEYFDDSIENSDIFILENIYELQFIEKNKIRVNSGKGTYAQININRINEVSIKSGTSQTIGVWTGIVIGAVIAGYAAGESAEPGLARGLSAFGGAILGAFCGGYMGMAVGELFPSYKTYDLNKCRTDKIKKLKKILEIERSVNK